MIGRPIWQNLFIKRRKFIEDEFEANIISFIKAARLEHGKNSIKSYANVTIAEDRIY